MKIAVYSGSFDPLHIGHLAIMAYLTRETGFDQVYLIVSPQNPLKTAGKAKSGRRRYKAAVEAVARYPELRVKVDDIELGMEPPHYTIRTLDALNEREPGNEFTLVIGADNLDNIHQWRDYRRLLTQYGVAVYPRSGYDMEALRDNLLEECVDGTYRIRLISAPVVDISSTRIREGLARGEDMSMWMM